MDQIRRQFEQYTEITEVDWIAFSARLQRKVFSKKALLLRAGQTEHYLSFMELGLCRYFLTRGDNELSFDFGFPGEFVSAYDSFLQQSPSRYNIEALADMVVWRLHYDDLQVIYAQTKIGHLLGRLAAEGLYLKKSKREKELLQLSAEERYLGLLNEQPQLIQAIPLKYLATYIGVTPQALSRIRRRIY